MLHNARANLPAWTVLTLSFVPYHCVAPFEVVCICSYYRVEIRLVTIALPGKHIHIPDRSKSLGGRLPSHTRGFLTSYLAGRTKKPERKLVGEPVRAISFFFN